MLLKLGVDISRLSCPVRGVLAGIDQIFALMAGREAVITSTYEGDHIANSLHYANNAVDLRLPERDTTGVVLKLRAYLGKDFDVVSELTHIHIEYDPKNK